jgi:integrase
MARYSQTGNVRKLCGCKGWKNCAHPWYLDFRPARGGPRVRRNLDELVSRHAADIVNAKEEAQRAMVAIRDNRDPKDLLPGDRTTLAELMAEYGTRDGAPAAEQRHARVIARAVIEGRRFGDWPAADVTMTAFERFQLDRPTVAGNRNLAYLRAMFNYAVLRRLVPSSPFKVGHVTAVKLAREESRTRRLQAGEEEGLLLAANGLRDIVIAALETGCRKGELLSLQWQQIGVDLFLPAGKTKAKKPRRVPISSALRTILDARRSDPAGDPLPPTAYVFGDEIGRQVGNVRRAWQTAVLRAHGHKPAWIWKRKTGPNDKGSTRLSPESEAAYRAIDLHFHDLRREAGSRWMDAGVPLATIQRWLGHHNIAQTSKYLAASLGGDADEMRAYEARIGRVPSGPLPNVAQSADPNIPSGTQSSEAMSEKTQINPTVH